MKHRVCTVGRPSGWAAEAVTEYIKRIQGFAGLEMFQVKEGSRKEVELKQKTGDWWSVCLDEKGESRSTADWRKDWEKWERTGHTRIAWIIGGADGHSDSFRRGCHVARSLGPQTLSHDLALVVLLEQIYRLESWRAGHPYHRT